MLHFWVSLVAQLVKKKTKQKQPACNAGDLGSTPGLGGSPGEKERLPTPVFSPGEFRGRIHGVAKRWTRLSDSHFTHTLNFHNAMS